MKFSKVPEATIRRLSRYSRCLEQLQAKGEKVVSSAQLATMCAVNAAQVHQDAASAEGDAKDGDSFGSAGQRLAPFCSRQSQDGGDEGAGVGQANEKDEVDDVHAPVDRTVHPGHTQAIDKLVDIGRGSRNDDEAITACNQHGMPMVFTGRRHFKH